MNTATPYHRLQHRRATFDEVAALSVEGLNKSAIARVKRIAWNTVDRWLVRAAECCYRFNDRTITGLAVEELQADEIRTIVGSKERSIWVFATIDARSADLYVCRTGRYRLASTLPTCGSFRLSLESRSSGAAYRARRPNW
jgi:hypothetical protein